MFRQFRSEVEAALADALAALDLPTDDLGIERPPDDMDATLASSVAFRLAGEVGDAPPNVAAQVAEAVTVDDAAYVASVDTAGPYVNFHANERYLADTLDAAAPADDYGALSDRDTSVVVGGGGRV
ncbi:arginine--tRNA ligase, partial [Halorubrum sp. SD626R]